MSRLYTLGKAAGFRGLFAGLGPRMIMTVPHLNDPRKIDFRHFWFLDSLQFMQISRKLLGRRHLLKFIKEKGNLVRMGYIQYIYTIYVHICLWICRFLPGNSKCQVFLIV